VASIVEAQRVEAPSSETLRERLVFEGVKAQPTQQYEGRRVFGAVPEPSVEAKLTRREPDVSGSVDVGPPLIGRAPGCLARGCARSTSPRHDPYRHASPHSHPALTVG
jgi:hypothetical protein